MIGGSGLVGRALVAGLAADGVEVIATARTRRAAETLADLGARVVHTDLEHIGAWQRECADAEVVWHLGLPRLIPPIRGRTVTRMTRRAAAGSADLAAIVEGRPLVVASSALVYGDVEGPVDEGAEPKPLALGAPALATERALAPAEPRIVRLPWVYGHGGLVQALVVGLRMRRARIVGDGENRWSLLGVSDAVEALRISAGLEPGVYNACEEDAPTQAELIGAICAAVPGFRRPDRVPRRMAAFSLGGPLADALAASTWIRADALGRAGWSASGAWRADLPELARDPEMLTAG